MGHNLYLSDTIFHSDLFIGTSKDGLKDILNKGRRQICNSGDTLFREGDPATHFYLVDKGRLKLSKLHEDGKEAIFRYINPGEITAAVSVFKGRYYPATARTVGPSETVAWKRDTFLQLLTDYPRITLNLMEKVMDRLEDIQNRYLELQAEQVEQRIARSILRIMKHSGRKTAAGILIDLRLSRQDLADYTGTTLYSVSRTMSRWEKKRWVESGRERIVVVDPHALAALSESC